MHLCIVANFILGACLDMANVSYINLLYLLNCMMVYAVNFILLFSLNIFECEQCGRKFKNKKNLIRHYGIHSGLKPFSCKICSKSFLHRSSLNTHLRKHSVEECSKCNKSSGSNAENDICSKSLNSVVGVNTASMEEGTVEISTDQHQSESLNVCSCSSLCTENCRNVIENNALLSDGHICKPFSCGICGKLFKLKSSLVTHNKTHFPNKAYK